MFLPALPQNSFCLEETELALLLCVASGRSRVTVTRHLPLPLWQRVQDMCMLRQALLTWPLAGSFLQLPHWLSLVQEALQEWESSRKLKGNQKRTLQISL